jgi:hypothetical protein
MKTCAICCDDIQNEQDGFKTPCNHYMHNTCLTQWLLFKNTCPICRHNICGPSCNTNNGDNDLEYDSDSDSDSESEIDEIQVNFSNEIYTSNYYSILDAIKEIINYITLDDEDIENYRFSNNWCLNETNDIYSLKMNTRNNIINILVGPELYNNVLYLDIEFDTICKKMSEYIRTSLTKDLLISNYSSLNLPTRINCY